MCGGADAPLLQLSNFTKLCVLLRLFYTEYLQGVARNCSWILTWRYPHIRNNDISRKHWRESLILSIIIIFISIFIITIIILFFTIIISGINIVQSTGTVWTILKVHLQSATGHISSANSTLRSSKEVFEEVY